MSIFNEFSSWIGDSCLIPCLKTERNCHKWLMQYSNVTFLWGTCTKLLPFATVCVQKQPKYVASCWCCHSFDLSCLTIKWPWYTASPTSPPGPPVLLEQRGRFIFIFIFIFFNLNERSMVSVNLGLRRVQYF